MGLNSPSKAALDLADKITITEEHLLALVREHVRKDITRAIASKRGPLIAGRIGPEVIAIWDEAAKIALTRYLKKEMPVTPPGLPLDIFFVKKRFSPGHHASTAPRATRGGRRRTRADADRTVKAIRKHDPDARVQLYEGIIHWKEITDAGNPPG